jgi:hypothetical protein
MAGSATNSHVTSSMVDGRFWGAKRSLAKMAEAATAKARDREREFLGLAPDDSAESVACDAPVSIAVDIVRGPVTDARRSSDRHSLLRECCQSTPLDIF